MKVVDLADFAESEQAALFVGRDHGAQVSFFVTNHPPGEGPDAHRHPYEETLVIYDGSVVFEVEGETVEAHAGQVVVVPAGAVHRFKAAGKAGARQVNIHPVAAMVTEWVA
jgi:quercetin dioxygenase-like cupin family protein